MPKINVDSSYFNHPKTSRLKAYCGRESDIYPIRLWAFAAAYFAKDGILKDYTGPEIESVLGYTGPAGNLIRALEVVGFVQKVENNYEIHDWREHAGFVWNYKLAGKKGGKLSGISRRKNQSKQPLKRSDVSLEAKSQNASTIELNGIELNRDKRERRFEKPTALAVAEYAQSLGFSLDGQKFWDYYESKGWVIGKSPMKSWQAAVRTWKKREQQNGQSAEGAFDWQTTKLVPRT